VVSTYSYGADAEGRSIVANLSRSCGGRGREGVSEKRGCVNTAGAACHRALPLPRKKDVRRSAGASQSRTTRVRCPNRLRWSSSPCPRCESQDSNSTSRDRAAQ
jgi:hypothetical protein